MHHISTCVHTYLHVSFKKHLHHTNRHFPKIVRLFSERDVTHADLIDNVERRERVKERERERERGGGRKRDRERGRERERESEREREKSLVFVCVCTCVCMCICVCVRECLVPRSQSPRISRRAKTSF